MWQYDRTPWTNERDNGINEQDNPKRILLQVCFRVTISFSRSYDVTTIITLTIVSEKNIEPI